MGNGTNRRQCPDLAIKGNERRPRNWEGSRPGSPVSCFPSMSDGRSPAGGWLVAQARSLLQLRGRVSRVVSRNGPTWCWLSDSTVSSADPHAPPSVISPSTSSPPPRQAVHVYPTHNSSHQIRLCCEMHHMICGVLAFGMSHGKMRLGKIWRCCLPPHPVKQGRGHTWLTKKRPTLSMPAVHRRRSARTRKYR